jgi:glycosyltransferase involved in cell wall biosynthesis
MNISIIIFCYNERENVEQVIHTTAEVAKQLGGPYEIIVVDDGSHDGTQEALEQHKAIKYIRHSENKGIGAALRTGYEAASGEYICAVPGDGQFNVNELLAIKPFEFNSFYSFYRPATDYNWYRQILTKGNKLFNQFILGFDLRDVNWIKVYRRDQLDFVRPELYSSIIESEICCKLIKSGCKPIELPSVYYPRRAGEAKGGKWATLIKALTEIWTLYRITRGFNKNIKAKPALVINKQA